MNNFENTKASALGEYVPAKLGFDEGENLLGMIITTDYSGHIMMVFENGKAAKVPISAYETKTNRKKLSNAYSSKSPLVSIIPECDNSSIYVHTTNGRAIIFDSALILPKSTRDTQGVQVITLKAKAAVDHAKKLPEEKLEAMKKYVVKSVPSAGSILKDEDDPNQMKLI